MFGIKKLEERIATLELKEKVRSQKENCNTGRHKWIHDFRPRNGVFYMDDTSKPYIRCEHCYEEYKSPFSPMPENTPQAKEAQGNPEKVDEIK